MKKLTMFCLLCMIGFGLSLSLRAEEVIPAHQVNLLNFARLKGDKYDTAFAYYTEVLPLTPGVTYTLVMSHAYLNDHLTSIESMTISFDEDDGTNSFDTLLTNDSSNGRAYVEFISISGPMNIFHIPVSDVENYEIMLYEGSYQDFERFVPYLLPTEVMSYGGILPVDYDHLPTLSIIESYVQAKDPSGNILTKTIVNDVYSSSTKLPGTYRITFETTFNQIIKRYYLDVKVLDLKAPTLSIEGPLTIPLHEKWTIDTIKSAIDISDNVDLMDATHLVVISDTYSAATTTGSYSLSFKATDSSGNEAILDVSVLLVDTMPPVAYGPTSIYLYTTDTPLTSTEIRNHFDVSDNVDKFNVPVSIIVDEYQQTTTPGRYLITYQAIDSSNNVKTFDVYIHVIEHRGPTFETGTQIIERSSAELMTEQEIIDWFIEMTTSQGLSVDEVTIFYNEYQTHEDQEGEYYVYLSYLLNGEQVTSRVQVSVYEESKPIGVLLWGSIALLILSAGGVWYIIKRKRP